MVHTLRFSDEEEKKFNEIYGDSKLSFSTIVKKRIFNTHTESKQRSGAFLLSLGNLSTHINMLKNHIDEKDKNAVDILNLMKKEVEYLWLHL